MTEQGIGWALLRGCAAMAWMHFPVAPVEVVEAFGTVFGEDDRTPPVRPARSRRAAERGRAVGGRVAVAGVPTDG